MARSKVPPRIGERVAAQADFTGSSTDDLARTVELSLDRMERALMIPRDRLQGMPHQPRQSLRDDEDLRGLARSIAEEGIIEPLLATPNPEKAGYYILIAGHRRLAAAAMLARGEVDLPVDDEEKLHGEALVRAKEERRAKARRAVETLPTLLRDVAPDMAFALALVENLQRTDLSRREVMDAVLRLKKEYNWGVREIARRTGRSRSDLSELLRIAEDPEVSALVSEERITPTAAAPLVLGPNHRVRAPVIDAIRRGRVTTLAEVEQAIAFEHERERPKGHQTNLPQGTAPDAAPGDARHEVSDIGHLTITHGGEAARAAAGTPEHATVDQDDSYGQVSDIGHSPADGDAATPDTIRVQAHERRIGGSTRAEALARDIITFAHERPRLDLAALGKLREARDALTSLLEAAAHQGRSGDRRDE